MCQDPILLGPSSGTKVFWFWVSKYNYLCFKYFFIIIIEIINMKNSIICAINIIILIIINNIIIKILLFSL
jgi:hypothetical protein